MLKHNMKWMAIFSVVLFLMLFLNACSEGEDMKKIKIHIDKPQINLTHSKKTIQNVTCDYDCAALHSFFCQMDVGQITIGTSSDNGFHCTATYTIRGESEADVDLISKSVETVVSIVENQTLKISCVEKESQKNIWEWLSKRLNCYDLQIKMEILLPSTFTQFEVKTETGNISFNQMNGQYNLSSQTGNIVMKSCAFNGDSKIKTTTGNIDLSLNENWQTAVQETIEVETQTGNIKVELNGIRYTKELEKNNKKIIFNIEDGLEMVCLVNTGSIVVCP